VAEWRDEADIIQRGGIRVMPMIQAREIIYPKYAATIAALIGQGQLYVRNQYQFKLPLTFCLLEPMDIVTINDAWLGLSSWPVRIIQVEEDGSGTITVTAQDLVPGSATPPVVNVEPNASTRINSQATPANVGTPVFIEPPSTLTGGAGSQELWIGVPCNDPSTGGYLVLVSTDGTSYAMIGQRDRFTTMGTLTATLSAHSGANPDSADTLSVDLSMSNGALTQISDANADAGLNLAFIQDATNGNEFLTFAVPAVTSLTVTSEAHTVPTSYTYPPGPTVDATYLSTWLSNTSVAYAAGGALTSTGTSPPASTGTYYVADGVYQFSEGDAGAAILLNYSAASPYHYGITYLDRHLYGTSGPSHASGTTFVLCDNNLFKYQLPAQYVGKVLHFKFPTVNLFGNQEQSPAGLTAYTYTPSGTGYGGGSGGVPSAPATPTAVSA
jgi:hypothetical protein